MFIVYSVTVELVATLVLPCLPSLSCMNESVEKREYNENKEKKMDEDN
jgi:hypothetical protein